MLQHTVPYTVPAYTIPPSHSTFMFVYPLPYTVLMAVLYGRSCLISTKSKADKYFVQFLLTFSFLYRFCPSYKAKEVSIFIHTYLFLFLDIQKKYMVSILVILAFFLIFRFVR